jgi:DNA cross-link repair 1A protein
MNTPTIIDSRKKPVTVTLLDANHCPGAVMFLFEVGGRRILHVGDFRWDRERMMQMPQLCAFGNSSTRLDEIYLDTTYCDARYTLPTQEEAILAAIEVATREMKISTKDKSMKTLFLFGSYTIGKERIYMSVAESLKSKVYVDGRRYRILSQVFTNERMRLFTTKKSETNLWVVPLGSVNFKQMNDYMEEGNKNKVFTQPYGRVVGFRPTGGYMNTILSLRLIEPCLNSAHTFGLHLRA